MPDRSRPGSTTTAPVVDVPQDTGEKLDTGVQNNAELKLQKKLTTIGMWNVRTLYATGKLEELTHEL